jgi:hypothetical protein
MRNTNQSLNHDIINKFNEIRQSFSIPISNLKKIYLLFLLSSLQIHRFLLNLLTKLHLILILNILQITLLVDLILHFPDYNCHFVSYNVFILTISYFSSLILLYIELDFHVPRFVLCYFVENCLVLTQIV